MKTILAALCTGVILSGQPAQTGAWEESTPESQGVDSAELVRLLEYVAKQDKNPDSLLIIRHGHLILEAYYPPYDKDKDHILNSVTKSIVSALTGIAIEKGYVRSDSTTLLDWFPEVLSKDSPKAPIELRHLLSMASGLNWPQDSRNNASREMDHSANWVQFILNRPMDAAPGTRSNYSNGDAHLVSAILQRATGEDALEFGWKNLFQPLGIPKPTWYRDPQGINIGSATVYMTPRNIAKLGYLYLHEGTWGGTEVVPKTWVRESLERHSGIEITGGFADYGYFWWLYPKLGMVEAWGGAGQRIGVFRELDLVVVMTADMPDDSPVSSFSSETYRRIFKAVKSPSSLPENAKAFTELQGLVREATHPRRQHARWPWQLVLAGALIGVMPIGFVIAWLMMRRRKPIRAATPA